MHVISLVHCAFQQQRTFSIANSSSAFTRISRAFSNASCLMNATYGFGLDFTGVLESESKLRTILFISLSTSSSFIGLEVIVMSRVVMKSE